MSPLLLVAFAVAAPPRSSSGAVNPFEEPDESALFELDEELVTVASRYAQTVRKAPNIVAVVNADTIRERGYRTVSDLLRDLPGIYLWKSGEGRDVATFRGVVSADNNKILLLIDGVPWYDGVYTHAFVDDFLPVSHVRQVEVIKGPGGAVYGTNAFAGVVNIVTYTGGELDGGRAAWTVGSPGRSDASVVVGGRHRVGEVEGAATGYVRYLNQRGDGLDLTPRDRHDVNGEDPKQGLAVGARVAIAGLDLQMHHVDYRHVFLVSEADDPLDVVGRDIDNFGLFYHYTTFHARYRAQVGRDVVITPQAWSHRYDNPGSYFVPGALETVETDPGVFETVQHMTTVETEKDTRRFGASVAVEARPGLDHVFTGGVGVESTRIVPGPQGEPGVLDREFVDGDRVGASTGFEAEGGLLNLYAYAQHTWTATPAVELVLGARYDQRVPVNPGDVAGAKVFSPTATPRAGVLIVPTEWSTVKVLYGRAFRMPNVRELLVTTTNVDETGSFEFANGSLEILPESIDTVEAEFLAEPEGPVEVRASASWSLVTREIDQVDPPNEYRNIDGSLSILGAEAEARGEWGPISGRVAYALTLAQYGAAGPYAGRRQFEFPTHMGKASVTGRLGDDLSATVQAEVYGPRPRAEWTGDTGLGDGSAYGLVHVSGRAGALGPGGRLGLGFAVRNATNTRYGTPMYRDEINRGEPGLPRYPREIEGEGRVFLVTVDAEI
jgi:outer membrane receptor protein involved in Fe transport